MWIQSDKDTVSMKGDGEDVSQPYKQHCVQGYAEYNGIPVIQVVEHHRSKIPRLSYREYWCLTPFEHCLISKAIINITEPAQLNSCFAGSH